MRLQGKTAIVTGGSRGIGASIAKVFAKEGASVIVGYRSQAESAEQVVADIVLQGGCASAVQADVTSPGDLAELCDASVIDFGGLDIFVNNAGWAKLQPLDQIDAKLVMQQLQTNIAGLIFGTQAAARVMNDGGRIINITSIAAKGGPGGSVYSATKAAGNTLTKCYAAELGHRKITVNAIAPAAVETDLYYEVGLDKNHENALAATPLGWIGTSDDVAKAAVFFASDDAEWITGEVLQVSGGRAM
ncbi:MAG: SDR family oxidoreductase [Cyanobacteria bacterium P01_E01_bin.43]